MDPSALRKSKVLQSVHRLSVRRGKEAYLVGGAVRDLFLGRAWEKDLDFVTAGDVRSLSLELAEIADGHAFSLNDAFGTWRVVFKRGKKVNIDFSPMQGKDILADLRRRDFTANSMAYSLEEIATKGTPALLDPLNGLSDLKRKLLRADSEGALRQDPLRMLRAYRLSATLGFGIEEETLGFISKHKSLIRQSAWERIRDELFVIFREPAAARILRGLHGSGLLEQIFTEISEWDQPDRGSVTILEHAFRTVEAGEVLMEHLHELTPEFGGWLEEHFAREVEEGISRGALLKFTAFFHDSGKPETRNLPEARVPFPDHDQEGQKINAQIARRLKLSRKSVKIVSELTRQHMRLKTLARENELTPRAEYRFFRDLGNDAIEAGILSFADALAAEEIRLKWPLPARLPGDVQGVRRLILELFRYYHEDYSKRPQKPLLNGKEIMKALGLPQGEKVGYLLSRLKEAEISGKVRTKRDALEYLKNIDRLSGLG